MEDSFPNRVLLIIFSFPLETSTGNGINTSKLVYYQKPNTGLLAKENKAELKHYTAIF